MSNVSRDASWAFVSDKVGKWLLHVPSGTAGKISRVYDEGEFGKSSFDPEQSDQLVTRNFSGGVRDALTCVVVQFEDGNAFMADPDNFLSLSEETAILYLAFSHSLGDFLSASVASWKSHRSVDVGTVGMLVRAALATQLRALTPRT